MRLPGDLVRLLARMHAPWTRFVFILAPMRSGTTLLNHILAEAHYRQLFGRDVTDDRVRARTKRHLRDVLLALLGGAASEGARRHVRKKKGTTAS